jgi:hypothetical protein
VFNREAYLGRAVTLRLLSSRDGAAWELQFDNMRLPPEKRVFGGIRSGPRTILTPGLTARYCRLALTAKRSLHLDTVEIYGIRP